MFNGILDNTIKLRNTQQEHTFKSVGITRLAIFLWIKISPGSVSVTSFGGALESEQPIRRYFGCYPSDSLEKYWGSCSNFLETYL